MLLLCPAHTQNPMFLFQGNISQSFQSPVVRVLLGAIAIALLYVFYKEVRKIPAKLFTLMITAFVDMVGLLMIIPLMPFYVKTLGGTGITRRCRRKHRHPAAGVAAGRAAWARRNPGDGARPGAPLLAARG